MGMLTRRMTIKAKLFIRIVTGSLSLILSQTGRWSMEKETPKSKVRTPLSQRIYLSCKGLSRPYILISLSLNSGVIFGLNSVIGLNGSPGARWIKPKLMVSTPQSVKSIIAKRLIKNLSIASPLLFLPEMASNKEVRPHHPIRFLPHLVKA